MKRMVSIFTIAVLLAACTSTTNPKANEEAALQAFKDSLRLAADTAGLADFQAWKAQNELTDPNQYNQASQIAAVAPVVAPVKRSTRSYEPARRTYRNNSTASRGRGYSGASESAYPAKAPAKRGWSKAAKGTVIGAGGGAVLGAVIHKRNRAVGAVAGGVLGGGVGYGIGRKMDKRDGRY